MSMPSNTTQLPSHSYLTGEIQALITFAQVLAVNSRDPAVLRFHLDTAAQVGLANLEALSIDDAVVDGFLFAINQIGKALDQTSVAHE